MIYGPAVAMFRRALVAVPTHPAPYIVPSSGSEFLVVGVMHRQDALRRAGQRAHLFRLVREPSNAHDPYAVAVVCGDEHIGYISAKMSKRYFDVLTRIEMQTGRTVFVHGVIERGDLGLLARIDCPFPEDF